MSGVCDNLQRCFCFRSCRPRYKHLVDGIYPPNPAEGLVANNMQKLTFYAISHPEKLDRIGEYLAQRLGRDIYRERVGYAKVTIGAMDRLLMSSNTSPGLNLFVESFLKMVQKLLETSNSELQILATNSFVNFSNIEEVTPSYHRRYDFFISKFSALCHNNHSNTYLKRKLRISGLKGLRGVVRKTVSDDLQANIWEQTHMDKIVPSLLFNMHDNLEIEDEVDSDSVDEVPKLLADSSLRELAGKASFGSLKFVLQPLLRHFDFHRLWSPTHFAVSVFKAIMYSIQSACSYVVIQLIMAHLDHHSAQTDARVRIGMATVLSEIVVIAATSSPVNPGLLEVFNNLLRHLRSSVEFQHSERCRSLDDEKKYQKALIETMGEFAKNLPDYQKVEVMMFIIQKVPLRTDLKPAERILQQVMVLTLEKVAAKYKTTHFATTLTSSFLEPLLKLSLVEDPEVRLLVQLCCEVDVCCMYINRPAFLASLVIKWLVEIRERCCLPIYWKPGILQSLLDRHENLPALEANLRCFGDVEEMQLDIEKCSRTDANFLRKNGPTLFSAIYLGAQKLSNLAVNFDAILYTMALISIEINNEETEVELFRLALAIQFLATREEPEGGAKGGGGYLTPIQKAALHNLVAKYLNFASQLMAIPALCSHVQHVIKERAAAIPFLDLFQENPPVPPQDGFVLNEELLFDASVIAEALQSSGQDGSRLSLPFTPRYHLDESGGIPSLSRSTHHDGGESGGLFGGSSIGDVDSVDSSLLDITSARHRRGTISRLPTLSFEEGQISAAALKEVAAIPAEKIKAQHLEKGKETIQKYQTLPFEELVARVKQRRPEPENMQAAIKTLLVKLDESERARTCLVSAFANDNTDGSRMGNVVNNGPRNTHQIHFPELFVY